MLSGRVGQQSCAQAINVRPWGMGINCSNTEDLWHGRHIDILKIWWKGQQGNGKYAFGLHTNRLVEKSDGSTYFQ